MARKDFEEFYIKLSKQYFDMKQDLEDIQKLVSEKVCDETVLDQIKTTIKPIKDSYEMYTYCRYLLNLPQRKEKKKKRFDYKFERGLKSVIHENDKALQNLKSFGDKS